MGRRDGLKILPGFVDLHVHFREPGFSAKETILTGSRAALRGGYIAVVTMPNLRPAPDTLPNLQAQLDIIQRDAQLPVIPVGSITIGQAGQGSLSDIEAMAPYVCGYSDDGVGVNDTALMQEAMLRAKAVDKPIIAHCEDLSFPGHESEWRPLARDLELAAQTGCHYHVCHVSTKESVALIRQAKRKGLSVSAETAPHYLVLCDEDVEDDGRFKMNPPIRGREDQAALLAGILDGTIDCIATDHAPHTAEEKSKGMAGSAFGIVGLETAFPVLYTKLVRENVMTLDQLVAVMAHNPRELLKRWTSRVFGGSCVWDLEHKYTIDPNQFESMGRSTPFANWEVYGHAIT